MRYLRLFSVLLLSMFAITGCHRRRARAVPPPQAQAPIVSTLPPIPPLTFPDVQIAKPEPPPQPVVQAAVPVQPEKPHKERVRHHRAVHKAEPETAAVSVENSAQAESSVPSPAVNSGASMLGQLSADDAAANPHQNVQAQDLILETEDRLKKISSAQQAEHKDAIAQVTSFLAQAKQALGMNDVVGAETLANKAKILLDELLK
jgi:type IV secretory pathway VirB10-like protein